MCGCLVGTENVHIVANPYINEKLTILRDRDTQYPVFRRILEELGFLLGVEMSNSLPTIEKKVTTPLGVEARGISIKNKDKIIIIPILRASIPLAWGLLRAYPEAKVGLVVAKRIEESVKRGNKGIYFDIELSYIKLPKIDNESIVVIADPMIATGSTIMRVLDEVLKYKPSKIIIVGVIATPYALERILDKTSNVEFYLLAIDKELNNKGYILPGLGDAGDRVFGN